MGNGSRLEHLDGLRGLAIIGVLLFHACPHNFPKGFLGVDMFFVIAGYFLFRGKNIDKDRIWASSGEFLKKKAIRLMFPLAVMVFISCLLGLLLTLPQELETSFRTGLYALLGVANIYLSNTAQAYFSPNNAYNPLMHTWYTSVLIQIFLLFAVAKIALNKFPRYIKVIVCLIIFSVSFFCSQYSVIDRILDILPDRFYLPFDYYSTTTRLWEVLAGGAIAFLPKGEVDGGFKRCKDAFCFFCIAAMVYFAFLNGLRMSRMASTVVVVATMSCMAWGSTGVCGKILTMRPLLFLGRISFSVYLVHMPVLAFYRSAPDGGLFGGVCVTVLILLASLLFYATVEKRKTGIPTCFAVWGASLSCSVILAFCTPRLYIWSDCYPHYTSYDTWSVCHKSPYREGLDIDEFKPYNGTAWMSKSKDTATENKKLPISREILLAIGKLEQPSFLLIGDSYASMLYYGLNDLCKEEGIGGIYLQTYIIPYYGWKWTGYVGSKRCDALVAWLKRHPEIRQIILAQNWIIRNADTPKSFNPEQGVDYPPEKGLEIFLRELTKTGCRVLIIDQPPAVSAHSKDFDPQLQKFKDWSCDKSEHADRVGHVNAMLKQMEEDGLCEILDISQALFRLDVLKSSEDGEYLYFDPGHLSPKGSERAVRGSKGKLLPFLQPR